MSYKLKNMPSLGFIQKKSNQNYSENIGFDELYDSGAEFDDSSSTTNFQTNVACVGRLIVANRSSCASNYVYRLKTSSHASFYGMIPIKAYHNILIGSEDAFEYTDTAKINIQYDGIEGGESTAGTTHAIWGEDSHIQYWRA